MSKHMIVKEYRQSNLFFGPIFLFLCTQIKCGTVFLELFRLESDCTREFFCFIDDALIMNAN